MTDTSALSVTERRDDRGYSPSFLLGLVGSVAMALVLVLPPLVFRYVLQGNLVGTFLLMLASPVVGVLAAAAAVRAITTAFQRRPGRLMWTGALLGAIALVQPVVALVAG